MTTILYSKEHNVFVADGRERTADGCIATDECQKIYHLPNGDVLAGAGHSSLIDRVVNHLSSEAALELAPLKVGEEEYCSAFIYCRADACVRELDITSEFITYDELRYSYAIGSGWQWALAAHDLGKSPEECVIYAASRDCYTGTNLTVYELGE